VCEFSDDVYHFVYDAKLYEGNMVIEVSEDLGTFHMCRNRRAGFNFCLTGSQFVLCLLLFPLSLFSIGVITYVP